MTDINKDSGVDYDAMDPFKKACQLAALKTSDFPQRFGIEEVAESRGESAYVMRMPNGSYLAHVEEGLGTKNKVAEALDELKKKGAVVSKQQRNLNYWSAIAQDTVAMIVNDLVTVGALPVSVAMHLAVGSGDWFADEMRTGEIIAGWRHACMMAQCAWGGGETPTLSGIICPGTVLLSGSATGYINDPDNLISHRNIRDGDQIVIIRSSGIHANGLSAARKVAGQLPDGYLTELPDGRLYGEALLTPTDIYVGLVEKLQTAGVAIHYAVNVTGHGWRKLMRAPEKFRYVITCIPASHPEFDLIQNINGANAKDMFATFNMGAGFALYVAEKDADAVKSIATRLGYTTVYAGHIEASDRRSVEILPMKIAYDESDLDIR